MSQRALTAEELAILQEVASDPVFFSSFAHIQHPVKGDIKFDLFPYQISCLIHFLKYRHNIILKFRQAGITQLIALYCLWMAMFRPNRNIIIISIKERVAVRTLKRIKYMYRSLPDFMKIPVINGKPGSLGTNTEMEFANGSIIQSIPTTEDAGRSEAVSLLVVDEAAVLRLIDEIWASAWPTLSTGGSSIINSTPYGVGNFYHNTWSKAIVNDIPINPIRLRWQMHPERDQDWYNSQFKVLGYLRSQQELEGDFLTSGNNVFDMTAIKAIEEDISYLHTPIETKLEGNLRIFNKPLRNGRYTIGADISSGRARDYSALSVMDSKGEEVAAFKGKISPRRMAKLMMSLGKAYNQAILAPEANEVGHGTLSIIQDAGYPNLYYSESILRERGEKRSKKKKIPGWMTTSKTRPLIINELEDDIRNEAIIIKSPYFVNEAYTFIYNDQNKPIAMGKKGSNTYASDGNIYHDDSIMATAITNHVRKIKRKSPIILPQ